MTFCDLQCPLFYNVSIHKDFFQNWFIFKCARKKKTKISHVVIEREDIEVSKDIEEPMFFLLILFYHFILDIFLGSYRRNNSWHYNRYLIR